MKNKDEIEAALNELVSQKKTRAPKGNGERKPPRPERQKVSGGGLAINVKTRASVMRYFTIGDGDQFEEMIKKGGKMVRAEYSERGMEADSEWLVWAPLGLCPKRLVKRLQAALPEGWSVSWEPLAKLKDSMREAVESGWAQSAMGLTLSLGGEDALDFAAQTRIAEAESALREQLAAMCDRPPPMRKIGFMDDLFDLLSTTKSDGLTSEARACRDFKVEQERQDLEEQSAPAAAARSRPRI